MYLCLQVSKERINSSLEQAEPFSLQLNLHGVPPAKGVM